MLFSIKIKLHIQFQYLKIIFSSTAPRELLARLEQLEDQKSDYIRKLKTAEKVARKPRVYKNNLLFGASSTNNMKLRADRVLNISFYFQSLNDVMHMDSLKNLEREDIVNVRTSLEFM